MKFSSCFFIWTDFGLYQSRAHTQEGMFGLLGKSIAYRCFEIQPWACLCLCGIIWFWQQSGWWLSPYSGFIYSTSHTHLSYLFNYSHSPPVYLTKVSAPVWMSYTVILFCFFYMCRWLSISVLYLLFLLNLADPHHHAHTVDQLVKKTTLYGLLP